MKKFLLIALLICIKQINAQTYVAIPDSNFVHYLKTIVPTAFKGDSLNTSSTLVTTTTDSISVSSYSITNLSGIQYFTSLTYLECGTNSLTTLPALPNTLTYLDCSYNFLDSLPVLPNSLNTLNCNSNKLHTINTFPNSLTSLSCSTNSLTSLPVLPSTLTYLNCFNNSLTNLPTLPNSLKTLNCAGNSLTNLPGLPNSLNTLQCNENSLTNLPTIPNSLVYLYCFNNSLTSLPTLPDSLQHLLCYYNQLTSLPTLPNTLTYLLCSYNNIACFPTFPNSIGSFDIQPNPYNCLPNYITVMTGNSYTATPLCGIGNTNGCPVVSSCTASVSYTLTPNAAPHTWDAYPTYSSNITKATWYWGDGDSTIGLYPSHTYSVAGSYNICVVAIDINNCSATSCQNDSVYRLANSSTYSSMVYLNVKQGAAGIEQFANTKEQVSIYPNPNNGSFIIETNSTTKQSMQVYDINGKMVLSQSLTPALSKGEGVSIDASSLNEGVYNISLIGTEGVINKRLVIVR